MNQEEFNSKQLTARNKTFALMAIYDHMDLRKIGQQFGLTPWQVKRILAEQEVDYPTIRKRRKHREREYQRVRRATMARRISTRFTEGPNKGKERSEYLVYRLMLQRCCNPNNPYYKDYGARGIAVCERWQGIDGFQNFYADMGPRPEGVYPVSGIALYSINRINNDGNYEPGNCEWAPMTEQVANRRKPNRGVAHSSELLEATM